MATTIVDAAGAFVGGAARFMKELEAYLSEHSSTGIQVIGRGQHLTPTWLIQRELLACRKEHAIALNNASLLCSEERTVLLRNALHFASRDELEALSFTRSRELRAQIPVIRMLARRATRIIVPCTSMRERVARFIPSASGRIHVRFHPVSVPASLEQRPTRHCILVPVVPTPYKHLGTHVARLIASLDRLGSDAEIVVTASKRQMPTVSGSPRVRFVGVLPADELEVEWARATAIYFPTTFESFGYPLAEARARGKRVIAANTSQCAEIAGSALAGFAPGDGDSLAAAVDEALTRHVEPDPIPFARNDYFNRLFHVK